MPLIKLEFEQLEIFKQKEKWQLFFILTTEHPTDNDKMIVTTFPDPYIKLKSNQNNLISFKPVGVGTDGLLAFRREMPTNKIINTRLYLRHSHQATRNLGETLQNIKTELGADGFDIASDILGTANPALVIAKKAMPLIGGILKKIKDRDFGFVSMDETFGDEFSTARSLNRENNFSTGEAKIKWNWSIQ